MANLTPFDDKIVEYLKPHGARRAGVFGSYGRGEARPGSDLVLLLWFAEGQSLLRMAKMQRELSDLLGIKVNLLTEDAISPYLIDRIKKEVKDLELGLEP